MTTLVVETGAGLSNANSYVTVAEADSFLETNKYAAAWADYDEEDKGNLLIYSTLLLDQYMDWFGTKTVEASALRWPRSGVFTIDGAEIADDEIPVNLKRAVSEFAFLQYSNNRTSERSDFGIDELKVDVIELKFNKSDVKPVFPDSVLAWLRGLGYPAQGRGVAKVSRS